MTDLCTYRCAQRMTASAIDGSVTTTRAERPFVCPTCTVGLESYDQAYPSSCSMSFSLRRDGSRSDSIDLQ